MGKKKLIPIIVIVFISIVGVAIYSTCNFAGDYQKSIYNDNSKIISKVDSYSYLYQNRNYTNDTLKSKFKFTGMDTIYNFEADEEGVVTINYDVNITSGKFKIVLIAPNNEVITLLEGTGKDSKDVKLSIGKSRLKIIGKNAKGNIEINISSKDDIDIDYDDSF